MMWRPAKYILITLFFPFYLLLQIFKPTTIVSNIRITRLIKGFDLRAISLRTIVLRTLGAAFTLLLLLPLWLAAYFSALYLLAFSLGFTMDTTVVRGQSMLPTLQDGEEVSFQNITGLNSFFIKPQRGDVVVFRSEKTLHNGEVTDYAKRVVALPGDKVMLRDGFVYINDEMIEEPYILKPRSTFGGNFVEECKSYTVPQDHVLVFGDNRKRSEDSRNLGYVHLGEINRLLPFHKQIAFRDRWHDPSADFKQAGLPSFDAVDYYRMLNRVREDNGLEPLLKNEKLEKAATLRAERIISLNELGIELGKSGYPKERALKDVGYSNIVTGEIVGFGYFDAVEMLDYWQEFETKTSILDPDYQDTGIAAFVGKVNGCETQVIVQEFGGYIPPNYKLEDIEGWQYSLEQLESIRAGWADVKNNNRIYSEHQIDVDRINEIIEIRLNNIRSLTTTMQENKWLTNEQKEYISTDYELYKEQQEIAQRLNNL